MKLKPSNIIKNNYIIDLEEGLKDKYLYDFLEFCDKYFQLTPEAKEKFKNMKQSYF